MCAKERERHESCTETCPQHHALQTLDTRLTVDLSNETNKQSLFDPTLFLGTTGKEWCKDERERHESCTETCPLHHALQTLDTRVTVDLSDETNKQILSDATLFVSEIAKVISDIEPLWKCSVERRGSCTNGLKTGRLDEIDFLLRMENIAIQAKHGWKMVPDSAEFSSQLSRVTYVGDISHITAFESHFQVVHSNYKTFSMPQDAPNNSGNWESFVMSQNQFGMVFAKHLKKGFLEVLSRAMKKIQDLQLNVESENSAQQEHFRKIKWRQDTDNRVHLIPKQTCFHVQLDITPCISFHESTNTTHWLVPRTARNNWATVNADPEELTITSVQQTVRIYRALVHSTDPSMGINGYEAVRRKRNVLLTQRAAGSTFTEDLDFLASSEYTNRAFGKPYDPSVSSYAIKGTVVQHYRQNPSQPLCALVLDCLANFKPIGPDGKLLDSSKRIEQLNNEAVNTIAPMLQILSTAGENLDQEIRLCLPPFYTGHTFPTDLAEELGLDEVARLSDTEPVPRENRRRFKGEKNWLKAGSVRTPETKSETVVKLYRAIHRNKFVKRMLQQIRRSKTEGREIIQELQQDEGIGDYLYVVVIEPFIGSFERYEDFINDTIRQLQQLQLEGEQDENVST